MEQEIDLTVNYLIGAMVTKNRKSCLGELATSLITTS
jgi:hypothetical protein